MHSAAAPDAATTMSLKQKHHEKEKARIQIQEKEKKEITAMCRLKSVLLRAVANPFPLKNGRSEREPLLSE